MDLNKIVKDKKSQSLDTVDEQGISVFEGDVPVSKESSSSPINDIVAGNTAYIDKVSLQENTEDILKLLRENTVNILFIGRKLTFILESEIFRRETYNGRSFSSFEEYCDTGLAWSHSQAFKYVKIFRTFGRQLQSTGVELENPENVSRKLIEANRKAISEVKSVEKLFIIAQEEDPEKREHLIDVASEKSVRDLRRMRQIPSEKGKEDEIEYFAETRDLFKVNKKIVISEIGKGKYNDLKNELISVINKYVL